MNMDVFFKIFNLFKIFNFKKFIFLSLLITITSFGAQTELSDEEALKQAQQEVASQTLKSSEKMNEKDIPLNLEVQKKSAQAESPFFKFMIFFSILGVLLTGLWIFLKKYKTQNISKNHNEIKILAQHYLGPKKSLAVVRVAGESILVGITDNNINMIKSLALLDDELPEVATNSFSNTLKQTEVKANSQTDSESEAEEFSIKGVKDIVSTKLKNMRSL